MALAVVRAEVNAARALGRLLAAEDRFGYNRGDASSMHLCKSVYPYVCRSVGNPPIITTKRNRAGEHELLLLFQDPPERVVSLRLEQLDFDQKLFIVHLFQLGQKLATERQRSLIVLARPQGKRVGRKHARPTRWLLRDTLQSIMLRTLLSM